MMEFRKEEFDLCKIISLGTKKRGTKKNQTHYWGGRLSSKGRRSDRVFKNASGRTHHAV